MRHPDQLTPEDPVNLVHELQKLKLPRQYEEMKRVSEARTNEIDALKRDGALWAHR